MTVNGKEKNGLKQNVTREVFESNSLQSPGIQKSWNIFRYVLGQQPQHILEYLPTCDGGHIINICLIHGPICRIAQRTRWMAIWHPASCIFLLAHVMQSGGSGACSGSVFICPVPGRRRGGTARRWGWDAKRGVMAGTFELNPVFPIYRRKCYWTRFCHGRSKVRSTAQWEMWHFAATGALEIRLVAVPLREEVGEAQ